MSISGYSRLLSEVAGGAALDLAELFGKPLQRAEIEVLVGKPQHAIAAEPEQDPPEIVSAKGCAKSTPRTIAPRPRLSVRSSASQSSLSAAATR